MDVVRPMYACAVAANGLRHHFAANQDGARKRYQRWRRILGEAVRVARAETQRLNSARRVPAHWLPEEYTSIEAPIVIVGSGRSGTTLLSAMLNAHSQVFGGPETDLLTDHESFYPDLVADRLGLDKARVHELARTSDNRWQFVEQALRTVRLEKSVTRVAIKSPTYTFRISDILTVFPNAQILCICRDGRDVAVSMRRYSKNIQLRYDATFSDDRGLSIDYCANTWRTFVNAFRHYERDDRCMLVRYEDLVSRPCEIVKAVCEFLRLPFEISMLQHHQAGVQGRQDLQLPHLLGVTQPLHQDSVGEWRNALSSDEIGVFEQLAGAELQHMGYPLLTSHCQRQGDSC
jgi:Sulfotransferase family